MTDIFLSYSSKDLDRVRPIRDRLAEQGFDIFWDQALPAGIDWDTWIRQHLGESECALVVWSKNSVVSDNVRHEATIAKRQGKLLAVLIDDLPPEEFPMGLYTSQCAKLDAWSGRPDDELWLKFQREVEDRLTPRWVKQSIAHIEANVSAEQARREGAERKIRQLLDQIEKEAHVQSGYKHERDRAHEDVVGMKAQLANVMRERDQTRQNVAALKDQLANVIHERDQTREDNASLKQQLANAMRERDQTFEEAAVAKRLLAERDKTLQASKRLTTMEGIVKKVLMYALMVVATLGGALVLLFLLAVLVGR